MLPVIRSQMKVLTYLLTCAASSKTTAVIGRFVATVLGRVCPAKAEEWYVVGLSLLRVPGDVKAGCKASFFRFLQEKERP